MKKYLVLAMVLFVSACANGPIYGDEDCTYHHTPRKNYRVQEVRPQPAPVVQPQVVQVAQPQVVPCYQPQPVIVQQPVVQEQPCNGCQPTVKTTREPVEIVYKKVIYTTTYEPKTTKNVVYEREPVKNTQIREVKVKQQPVVKEVVKEVVVEQPAPTVSKVIETQVTQEPVKISVEEVK